MPQAVDQNKLKLRFEAFLVQAQRPREVFSPRLRGHRGWQPGAPNKLHQAVALTRREAGIFPRHRTRRHHANANRLAMQVLSVPRRCLDCMPDGMPEVEDLSQVTFALVVLDDVGLMSE